MKFKPLDKSRNKIISINNIDDMLILTVHGLGGFGHEHALIKYYLQKNLKSDERIMIDTFCYSSRNITFDQVVKDIQEYLNNYKWMNDDEKTILIGHSLGGVIVTHLDHYRIKGAVTLASPHTGCDYAKFVKDTIPTTVSSFFLGQMYDPLVSEPKESTIPKITCITCSWYPWCKFDGKVYTKEMVHPQASKVMHLEYSDHLLQLADPRMMNLVYDAVIELME